CKEAINNIVRYCEKIGASIVATPQGKGLVNPYHPNFYGVCGLAGHESATDLLKSKDTDLIIIVGSALDQFAICGWKPSDVEVYKFVHIDSIADHFSRSQYAILNVFGNIRLIFGHLNNLSRPTSNKKSPQKQNTAAYTIKPIPFERRRLERRKQYAHPINTGHRTSERREISTITKPLFRNFKLIDELKYLNDESPIKPQRLMYELSKRAPENTRFLADMGNSFLWAIHYLNPHPNKKTDNYNYLTMGMGFASMAWCIGAAIGIALANPKNPIICIVGDGSFLMSAHELTVAVQLKLPIIYIVLNDQAYGMVKHGQNLSGAESIGSDLPPIDFALYARAIGAQGITVKSPEDFANIDILMHCQANGPVLIDAHIDATEAPPLSERIKMIASGKN
ncbi:thiamine pyrophosphate-binding protein, partial [Gammaproteobacteria bacterium AH-315-C21]|nr:thiamine pyrophosphate-binding protein [Gammaproteobacteria bacterium AH-315-C21]